MSERLPGYQQQVAQFVADHGLEAGIESRLLDLTSEVGELAKEALKITRYGRKPFFPNDEWEAELADCFFSLLCVANLTGVDLDEALERALDKYEDRLERRGDAGSGQ